METSVVAGASPLPVIRVTVSRSPAAEPAGVSAAAPATDGPSMPDSGAAGRLLTGQVLQSLSLRFGQRPALAQDLGFAPPDNGSDAGAQLAGAVRGLAGGTATGEPTLPVPGPQVAAGIEAGYQETVRLLAQKGPIPGDIQLELQQSRDLAIAAAADATPSAATGDATATGDIAAPGVPAVETAGTAAAGAQSVRTQTTRSAVIRVQTRDGDSVALQIDAQRATRLAALGLDNGAAADVALEAEQSREAGFSLQVNGDIDRGEAKALRKLFHRVEGVLKKFARADYAEAFEKFAKLELDTKQLADVSLDLSRSRSVTVAGLYAAAAGGPRAPAAPATDGGTAANAGPATDPARPLERRTVNRSPVAAAQGTTSQGTTTSRRPTVTPVASRAVAADAGGIAGAAPARATAPAAKPAAVVEPAGEVVRLANLLEPLVGLFRETISGARFAEPGWLIADLAGAIVELQGDLRTDADEGDDGVAPADGDHHSTVADLFHALMGALEDRHEDEPHHDREHDHDEDHDEDRGPRSGHDDA